MSYGKAHGLKKCNGSYGNSELSERSLDLFTIETSTPVPPPNDILFFHGGN